MRDRVLCGLIVIGAWLGLGQAVALAANPACPSAASSTATSCTYAATGAEQAYAVPAGVTHVTIDAIGAHGGSGNNSAPGGHGADVTATVALAPGTSTLYVEVGTPGRFGFTDGGAGFNGGGQSKFGGGGGGASDVRSCSLSVCTDLSTDDTRLVVAGGGGGGQGSGQGCRAGGGSAGDSSVTGPGDGGAGGSCNAGKDSGFGGSAAGAPGPNGNTNTCTGQAGAPPMPAGYFCQGLGAGGGGGYFGGGGGGDGRSVGGGGGAGSSFWVPDATRTAMTEAAVNDASQIVVTAASATSTTLTSSRNPAPVGTAVTYTASVSPTPDGGTLAFIDGATTIPGCGSQPVDTVTGTAACAVTYGATGTHSISAAYTGDAAFLDSSSASISQRVVPVQNVVPNPSASIATPASPATFAVGERVVTSFACLEGAGGPGIASCLDSNGASAPSGLLDTSRPGTFTYSVTATSSDGQTGRASVTYTVAAAPSASISTPGTDAVYTRGQRVSARYSCQEGAQGPGLSACLGTVPDGASIDTARLGRHAFTVTAISADGQRRAATVSYTVARPSNRFTVSRIRTFANGRLRFTITVPGPGRIDVLETAWKDNLASTAIVLNPAPGRFVYARKHLRAGRSGRVVVTVRPGGRGRRLVAHPRYRVTLRLWVSFTPRGGLARSRGFYAIKLPR